MKYLSSLLLFITLCFNVNAQSEGFLANEEDDYIRVFNFSIPAPLATEDSIGATYSGVGLGFAFESKINNRLGSSIGFSYYYFGKDNKSNISVKAIHIPSIDANLKYYPYKGLFIAVGGGMSITYFQSFSNGGPFGSNTSSEMAFKLTSSLGYAFRRKNDKFISVYLKEDYYNFKGDGVIYFLSINLGLSL